MTLALKFLRLEGFDPQIPLPNYASTGAAGADIRANFLEGDREGKTLTPGERQLIPTGLAMEVPDGFEVQIRPRSGLALKQGLALVNSPGTIDSDYRGHLGIILINLGDQAVEIAHGDRVAQMIVAPVTRLVFTEVDALAESERGGGGFGSTGRS